jgi:AcrR family transcriptional regulator
MTRSYDMRKRGQAADETTQRIIQAVHELLEHSEGSLSLQEVADAASVSRATLYNRVGSRRDLLAAAFEDQGRIIEYDRVLVAMQIEDPVSAVIETIRESCRAWAVIPKAIRKTLALATVDPEAGQLVQQYEAYRRQEIRPLAVRLTQVSAHRDESIEEITTTLALLTSFQACDLLRASHSSETATRLLVDIAVGALRLSVERNGE